MNAIALVQHPLEVKAVLEEMMTRRIASSELRTLADDLVAHMLATGSQAETFVHARHQSHGPVESNALPQSSALRAVGRPAAGPQSGAIMSSTSLRDVSVAGTPVDRYFHICVFVDSREQQYTVLRSYDAARLTGTMMLDILRIHPLTLVKGVVHENSFFTPPDVFLRELGARGRREPMVS
jgi:hypothetical protein